MFVSPNAMFGVSCNVVRKVTIAARFMDRLGSSSRHRIRGRDVAQIGQVDLTWDMSRFAQLQALYSRTFAGQYIKAAGDRTFDDYRLQIIMASR
jgi:hypothetical protein